MFAFLFLLAMIGIVTLIAGLLIGLFIKTILFVIGKD
jgi:hypothetical protein